MTFESLRNKILSAFASGNTARGNKLSQEYSTGKTHYTPPVSYPTSSTRVYKNRDVLFSKPPRQPKPFLPVEQALEIGAIYHKYPQLPGEFNKTYQRRLAGQFEYNKRHPINLDRSLATYNADPAAKFFKKGVLDPSRKTFTAFDIESDDYNHPLSITAIKYQKDPTTGEPVVIDTYQRFYKTHGWNVRNTQSVHGFTPKALKNLRKQQGATYSDTYNEQEMLAFHDFVGNSTLIGHNILLYDIPKSFPGLDIKNATIDTLNAARSAWKGMGNSLDEVFYRIFGKTMEEAGLDHHDASSDTIAAMMIAEAMSKDEGIVGKSIKYVMNADGRFHIAEWNEYVNSMLTRGRYWRQWSQNKENEVFMDEYELGLAERGGKDDVEVKKWLGNMHLMSPEDQALVQSSIRETAANIDKLEGVKSIGDSDLRQALNEFNNYKRFSLIERLSHAKSELESDYILASAGYESKGQGWVSLQGMAKKLKEAREAQKVQEFEEGKEHKIDRYGRYHYLSKADEAALRATKNWEELSDAIEDVTKKNENLMKVYHAMADIKPYDVNQYIASAKRQWGGTMGASQGVIPNFIRNPAGRLGDAFFNLVDRSVAPWNAFNRTWNSGIGQAITAAGGAIGGVPGMMVGGAISGTVSAASQIYGNYKQAGMEMRMLNIQNNLNSLGAMISWIATPFQLLHKAIKLVTGAFGGLTFKLNNIMGSGIGMMSQMGNPLEQLTGVGYGAYQGAGLVDMASLLKGGSTNAAIENLAMMQRDLYRYGKVDVDKMIAANMLGVFEEAFIPSTDTAGSYYGMANKILRSLQGVEPGSEAERNIMFYANKLDPTLAQTVRSAHLLGVSDIRNLESPNATGNKMYWRALSEGTDGEEGSFRRTQFEYGVARQQFGFSKMRIADKLWNAVGRDLYNGVNEVIDKLQAGNWSEAWDVVKASWEKLKDQFMEVWEGKGLGDKVSAGLDNAWDKVKEWGGKIANGIIDIWDQIFLAIVKKAQGLIAYLSTVQVGLEKDENGNWGINLKSIGSVGALDRYRSLYDVTGINSATGETYTQLGANMSELDKFAMKYVPNYANKKALGIPVTPEDLAQAAMAASIGTGEGITLEDYGLTNFKVHNRAEAYDLLQMLYEGGSGGTGYRRQASLWRATERIRNAADPAAYNLPIYDTVEKLISEEQDIRNTIGQHYLGEKNEATLKLELFSEGEKKGSVKYEGGRVTYEGMSPLSSVGLGKGISVKVAQQQGG